jgi:hypothetical protein
MKEYFYQDEKGVMQKFIYCTTCLKGPFKQGNHELTNCGSLYYCKTCASILRLRKDTNFRAYQEEPAIVPSLASIKKALDSVPPLEIEEELEIETHKNRAIKKGPSKVRKEPAVEKPVVAVESKVIEPITEKVVPSPAIELTGKLVLSIDRNNGSSRMAISDNGKVLYESAIKNIQTAQDFQKKFIKMNKERRARALSQIQSASLVV